MLTKSHFVVMHFISKIQKYYKKPISLFKITTKTQVFRKQKCAKV